MDIEVDDMFSPVAKYQGKSQDMYVSFGDELEVTHGENKTRFKEMFDASKVCSCLKNGF